MTTLVEAGIKGGSAHKHKWNDDERDIVRREYNGTNKKSQQIADKLSYITGDKVTLFAVKGQATKMGIMQDKSPDWTDREIEILTEMIHQYSPITIARRLHRSLNAVVVKSNRLGLKRRFRDGWYTKKDVCEIFGVDHKWIGRRIDNGELKALPNNGCSPQKDGGSYWRIKEKDLRDFIVGHSIELTSRNVDLFTIVNILTG